MRPCRSGWHWLVLTLAAAVPASASSSHVAPKAVLTHQVIGVEQTTTLVIEVESSGLASVAFQPHFELENLDIVGRPSRSEKMSYANGRVTRNDSLSWRLRPLEVGPGRVFAIRVEIGDKVFILDELAVVIQEDPVEMQRGSLRSAFDELDEIWDPFGRRRSRSTPRVQPKVFLRAEATPREPFVGQQVLYTLYLFTQADVGAINPEKLPEFSGAWVHEIPQPEQQRAEMVEIQEERYGRVVLLRKALFPLREGPLEFDPVTARMVIKVPERSVFGPLLDRTEEIERTSNRVSIDVKALPDPPDGFEGAVGRLALEVDLEPTELEMGQAATLKVSLTGEGHIQGLATPKVDELDGVRRFPPEQGGGARVVGNRVKGERSWTWVLVPEAPGRWEVPAIRYPYFDPTTGEFKVASSEPKTLVAKAEAGAARVAVRVPEAEPEGAVPATSAPGDLAAKLAARPWVLGALVLVPVLLVLALKGVRSGSRRRHEAQQLRERLRVAAAERRPRQVAGRECRDRRGCPPSPLYGV